uniref:GPI mannosyltransferase 1 n=1 Tax=Trypanosoma congolense (strain IL3000) TaxID=1068625 RepID=G0UNS8_TRYCI|nr:putative mannosyltransferase [Trypanosoma congolense IL3000]
MVPTTLCYLIYGQRYIDEAFLYHVQREDHRHNFSPYWLLMYLNMAQQHLGWGANMAPGIIAFVPQALVLIFVSYKLRRNVAHACCVETILFIAFNKVCTVQYFVWFIPFLAFLFCQPRWLSECELQGDASAVFPVLKTALVVLVWAGTIPLWVSTAVPLEFHGHSDFAKLWLVSCLFFLSMVALASFVTCVAYRIQRLEGTRKAIKSA